MNKIRWFAAVLVGLALSGSALAATYTNILGQVFEVNYVPDGTPTVTLVSADPSGPQAVAAARTEAHQYRGAVQCSEVVFKDFATTLLADGGDWGTNTVALTFPEGRILVIGASIDATVTLPALTSLNAHANDTFYISAGSAKAGTDDAVLTGATEIDILPALTGHADNQTEKSWTWQADMVSGGDTVLDGTAAAQAVYINVAAANAAVPAAGVQATVNGVLRLYWVWLGDD